MTEKHRHDTVALVERARAARTQQVAEIQHFGTIAKLPTALDAGVCAASVENLNQLLADTMTLPVQISRLLQAHEIILNEGRAMARKATEAGDDGTNDLLMSERDPDRRDAGVVPRRAPGGRGPGVARRHSP